MNTHNTNTHSQPLEAGQLLVNDLPADTADARLASAFAKESDVLPTSGFVLTDDGSLSTGAQNLSFGFDLSDDCVD